MYQPSRPLLEAQVRRRVAELPNATILDRREVLGLVAGDDGRRVTGVRIATADGGEQVLTADLVLDAMGRAAHTPAFLRASGTSGRRRTTSRYAPPTSANHCGYPRAR